MDRKEKWQYVVPTWLSGVLGGIGVCAGVVIFFDRGSRAGWSTLSGLLLFLLVVLAPWLGFRLAAITRSKTRERSPLS